MKEFIIKSDLYAYNMADQTIFFDTEKPNEIEIVNKSKDYGEVYWDTKHYN